MLIIKKTEHYCINYITMYLRIYDYVYCYAELKKIQLEITNLYKTSNDKICKYKKEKN